MDIVNLGAWQSFWLVMVDCPGVTSARRHQPPDREGSRSQSR
jgi:hypothetical protein